MAVIYDNSAAGTKVSGVISLTFSLTVTTGTSALVIGVGGTWPDSSKPNASGAFITYNGVKFVQTVNNVEISSGIAVASYVGGYLMEPNTGANDIVITMQSSTDVTWLNAIVIAVSGPTSIPSFVKSYVSGTTTARSTTISSQANGVVVSIALLNGNSNAGWTVDAQSSLREAATYATPWVLKGATKTGVNPSTTVTWTNNEGAGTRRSVLMTFSFTPKEITLSPTYYYDFQTDTTGYMANGFTPFFDFIYGDSWTVSTAPGEINEKVLTCVKASYNISGAYNNSVGKLTLNDQPIEIAAKFKHRYNDSRTDAVPTDFMTLGFMLDDASDSAFGFTLRYGYSDEFRLEEYNFNSANTTLARRKWKSEGIITCSTSSNIVTGAMDPAKPPYNFWFNNYTFDFIIGEYYQIMKLGNSDWNYVANTTGVTYKVGDIIQCVNVGLGSTDGEGLRKTPTRFQSVGVEGSSTYIASDSNIVPNAKLYHIDGTEIGTIQSITSATSLTLTAPAKINATGVQFKMHPDTFVPMSNTWYYIRYRRDLDGTYKAKIWPTTGTEPEGWLLDSTPNKGKYEHNIIDDKYVKSLIGPTSFTGNNLYYAQIGMSFDGGVASLDGTFPPSIISVDTDNILTSVQTDIIVAGYHLIGVTTATIIQGTTSIPQNVTIVSDTTATFNLSFDTITKDVKYGTAVLRFESPTGRSNKTITISPPDARCYRDLISINTTSENRLTALPDLDIGDQVEVLSVNGGDISSVNINSDGTFDADASVKWFTCRAWSAAEQVWGNFGVQQMVAGAIRRRIIVIL